MDHQPHHIKRLYRSRKDRMFAGVIGGLGEFFNIDSTLIRLIWTLVVIFTGVFPGVVAYVIAAMVVPEEGSMHGSHTHNSN